MPIENHQASNKFYVDIVVESANAGDKALRKIQDGSFASTGEINMSGNSITGLPNPIDRDVTANKNYVDNGGAIAKNPDGKFTSVSDIDFNSFSLKNILDPTDKKDAANLNIFYSIQWHNNSCTTYCEKDWNESIKAYIASGMAITLNKNKYRHQDNELTVKNLGSNCETRGA